MLINQEKIILETERLSLREFKPVDAEFLMKLVNTPDWIEFIGDKNFLTEADAIDFINTILIDSYNIHGFGSWLVELKDFKTPIGLCGLVKRESLESADIGYALLPEHTKKGYAIEITKAALEYGHKTLNLNPIVAITDLHNHASVSLLNKLGMRFIKNITLPGDDHVMLYST